MGNVQFEDRFQPIQYRPQQKIKPGLVSMLMKFGMERRTAEYALIGITLCCILITFFLIRKIYSPESYTQPTYLEDIPPEIRKSLPPELLKKLPPKNEKR